MKNRTSAKRTFCIVCGKEPATDAEAVLAGLGRRWKHEQCEEKQDDGNDGATKEVAPDRRTSVV